MERSGIQIQEACLVREYNAGSANKKQTKSKQGLKASCDTNLERRILYASGIQYSARR